MSRFKASFLLEKDKDGNPTTWVQIFKYGDFDHYTGDFKIDVEFGKQLVSNFETLKKRLKDKEFVIPVDYNHQSLSGAGPEVTKAAGWISDVELREEGIYAKITWTKAAADYIRNNEFKYISPEFVYDGDTDEYGNEIEGPNLLAAALTTRPFLKGMEAIECSTKATGAVSEAKQNKESHMKEKLQKLFKLTDASEDALLDRVEKTLQEGAKIREALSLSEGEDPVARIKDLSGKTLSLTEEVKKLSDSVKSMEADASVKAAIDAGKVAPAQKDWARKLALQDKALFDEFVKNAPNKVEFQPTGGQGAEDELTGNASKDLEAAISKAMLEQKITYPKALEYVKKTQPALVEKAYAMKN